ncbi:hypothetical protein J1N35_035163 [Gossypium stocksii]|uniref:Uncharacterized protein n=1 Tax=Gossypium stocksii TaxID=47602 RepID=A0A9D3ZQU3_9ROSI|nr:hypothetical protein J1N35_035163 [Gossypium stocksii]
MRKKHSFGIVYRATHNWKTLKELEKAIQVRFMYSIRPLKKAYFISTLLEKGQNICLAVLHYLSTNDDALEYSWKQAIKLDINIERDLAYALKAIFAHSQQGVPMGSVASKGVKTPIVIVIPGLTSDSAAAVHTLAFCFGVLDSLAIELN